MRQVPAGGIQRKLDFCAKGFIRFEECVKSDDDVGGIWRWQATERQGEPRDDRDAKGKAWLKGAGKTGTKRRPAGQIRIPYLSKIFIFPFNLALNCTCRTHVKHSSLLDPLFSSVRPPTCNDFQCSALSRCSSKSHWLGRSKVSPFSFPHFSFRST